MTCIRGSLALKSGFDVAENRELGDVVKADIDKEHHQHDESRLVDAFFHDHADVVPQQTLDQQKRDEAPIEDREREQVENAEIEADSRCEAELRSPVLG